ncbi:MAG: RusA family crossover junction endodeoxyribonuclease [Ruminiclostridium sp.]
MSSVDKLYACPSKTISLNFFMPMIPPTVTKQEHRIGYSKNSGKAYIYDSPEIADACQKLEANLAKHIPPEPIENTPVRLMVKWLFPIKGKHKNGEYKTSKPDTDNLQKMLKDSMTRLGFWKDDALVASEIVEKFWADIPGIYIEVMEL